MRYPLTYRAGNRQKCLLIELEKLCVISQNSETKLWERGALSCKIAKDLLIPSDKTIDEKIKELEPSVLRLEREAKMLGISLSGFARQELQRLYEQKNLFI